MKTPREAAELIVLSEEWEESRTYIVAAIEARDKEHAAVLAEVRNGAATAMERLGVTEKRERLLMIERDRLKGELATWKARWEEESEGWRQAREQLAEARRLLEAGFSDGRDYESAPSAPPGDIGERLKELETSVKRDYVDICDHERRLQRLEAWARSPWQHLPLPPAAPQEQVGHVTTDKKP